MRIDGCHGPSTLRPARQTAARRKKPAVLVGMTIQEKAKRREEKSGNFVVLDRKSPPLQTKG